MRAIYGTDITSYVLTHFALLDCEESLPAQFPIGSKATTAKVVACVGAVLDNATPFCLDFEDFNSQHSRDHRRGLGSGVCSALHKKKFPNFFNRKKFRKKNLLRLS
jgi:hypothetical protein